MKNSICIFLLLCAVQLVAQNDFQKEVDSITLRNDTLWNNTKATIVFTGSSSIRFWNDLQERFPNHHILNSGFGGSQTADLLYHLDKLVLKYGPQKVFIYEGDNDIFAKKRIRNIIGTMNEVIQQIKKKSPQTEIVLVSAKPSISRWNLRGKYKRLNKRFSKIALADKTIQFANVWDIMLDGRKVRTDIFIEDGLHMNITGYDLWYQKIKEFLP